MPYRVRRCPRRGGGLLLLVEEGWATASSPLLRLHQEVGPAVLTPAVLGRRGARWTLLAVADDRDARRADTKRDQIVHRCAGSPIGERHVVLGRTALIRVPFDEQRPAGIGLERLRVRLKQLSVFRTDIVTIEVEVDVLEI